MDSDGKMYSLEEVAVILGYSPNSTGYLRRLCKKRGIGKHLKDNRVSDWVLSEDDIERIKGGIKRRV